ncbi:hypothetical protein CDAR_513011 [Caerostris darwini]|uniref:Uncharacterized protein n=1 Tax=Caerostris darwini TaxID=1538125 RepID=A0AAV4RXA6_9ARAC|nr:hypothetical protein CDAR_513011 [Caerostris darwini]
MPTRTVWRHLTQYVFHKTVICTPNVRIQQLSIPVCTKSSCAMEAEGTNPVTRSLEIAHKKLALWRHYSTLNDTSRKHIMDLLMIQLYGGESVDASVDKDPFSDMHCRTTRGFF